MSKSKSMFRSVKALSEEFCLQHNDQKMILITGASKGIGNDICLRLIQNGHKVIGLSRDVSNLNFESYSCDVGCYSELNAVAKKLSKNTNLFQHLLMLLVSPL